MRPSVRGDCSISRSKLANIAPHRWHDGARRKAGAKRDSSGRPTQYSRPCTESHESAAIKRITAKYHSHTCLGSVLAPRSYQEGYGKPLDCLLANKLDAVGRYGAPRYTIRYPLYPLRLASWHSISTPSKATIARICCGCGLASTHLRGQADFSKIRLH